MATEKEPSQKKRKPGRPKGSSYKIDLNKLAALARLQCMKTEAARELNITVQTFDNHLKADKEFADAWETGKVRGKIQARQVWFTAMMDHYFSFCQNPACMTITDDPNKFYGVCPVCKSEGVDENTGEPIQTTMKHHREPGQTRLLEIFGKNYLDMTDKVMIQGDAEKPLEVNNNVSLSNVSDEDLQQLKAIAKRAGNRPGVSKKAPS